MKRFLVILAGIAASIVVSASPLKESVIWDKILRHPAPLPVIGSVVPIQSDLSRPSLWSVGCETLDRDYGKFDNFVQYMGETGVGYARLQSGWAKSEPKKGKYNFAWLDHHVDGLLAQGIHPWMCLCYGNPIYTDYGFDLDARIFGDGPVMDAWLKYVRQVVKRYKGKVTMYEVWNEPDGAVNNEGQRFSNWAEYANLFVQTARVIREEDPEVKIAAFGAFSITKDYFVKGMARIKELGGADLADFVTYHAYIPNPDHLYEPITKLLNDCREFNPNVRLLQGECGCPAQLEYGHALRDLEWSELSQVKWDLRHMLVNFSMGIPASVFTMVDLDYGWMQQSFGLIRTNGKGVPVYKRPKFHGVQHVTSIMTADMKPVMPISISKASTNDKITSFGIEKNGKTIGYMLWFSGDRPDNDIDRELVDMTIDGAVLEDPVYVDMVSGYVHDMSRNCVQSEDGLKLTGLPMWDAPVLIIEREQVNYK